MIGISVIQRVEFGTIIRFFLVLSIIPLFAIIRIEDFKNEYRIFILLAVAKSILLLYFAIILIRTGSYIELRNWAEVNHYGDIYINPYTHLPKVQVHGNGILPMVLILSISYGKRGVINTIINLVLALGTFSAGNSAYLLGIAVFCIYRLYINVTKRGKSNWIKMLSVIILIVGGVAFMAYAIYILSLKSGYSDAIRLEQAKALMDNYIVVGNGLGHKIFYVGEMRSYSGDTYFELQTLYIFNQIGLVGLFMFYWLTIKPIKKIGRYEMMLFLIYLLYTFWNPYCFDSTEMIVVSLLTNYSIYTRQHDNTYKESGD